METKDPIVDCQGIDRRAQKWPILKNGKKVKNVIGNVAADKFYARKDKSTFNVAHHR